MDLSTEQLAPMPDSLIHLHSLRSRFTFKKKKKNRLQNLFQLGKKYFLQQIWHVFAPSEQHYLLLTAWNPFMWENKGTFFFLSVFWYLKKKKNLHDNTPQGKLSQELGNGPMIAVGHKPIKCFLNQLLTHQTTERSFSKFMSAFYFPEWW